MAADVSKRSRPALRTTSADDGTGSASNAVDVVPKGAKWRTCAAVVLSFATKTKSFVRAINWPNPVGSGICVSSWVGLPESVVFECSPVTRGGLKSQSRLDHATPLSATTTWNAAEAVVYGR